jgi:hypothetical protein
MPLGAQLGNGCERHVCVELAMYELLALRTKQVISKESPPNMKRHASAIASSNPVCEVHENADGLTRRAANLSRMSCSPLNKIRPDAVREADASQPQLHFHQRLRHVRVDEPWVFKRVGDGERQMSGAGFHPPKGGRDTHQSGDIPQARTAFDKSLGFLS